jgi:alpha-glucosidase (family GH31 glycosyl hydrolase)
MYEVSFANRCCRYGHPLVRSLWMHYPTDPVAQDIGTVFMIGDALIAAPVLAPNTTTSNEYLPEGTWVDVWTGNRTVSGAAGTNITVDAPLGRPPMFYVAGSIVGSKVATALANIGPNTCS